MYKNLGYIFSETTDLQGLLSRSAHGRGIVEIGCGLFFSPLSKRTSWAESGCIGIPGPGRFWCAVTFDLVGAGLRNFPAFTFRIRVST
jgi:hypothetical protein